MILLTHGMVLFFESELSMYMRRKDISKLFEVHIEIANHHEEVDAMSEVPLYHICWPS